MQDNIAAQEALRQMRKKQEMDDPNDPGMSLAHNISLKHPGTPAPVAAGIGTLRNAVAPALTIDTIWNLLFGNRMKGGMENNEEIGGTGR